LLNLKLLNKKRLASMLLIIMATGILTACNPNPNSSSTSSTNKPSQTEAFEAEGFYMGTVITQKVFGANGQATLDEVNQKIGSLEKLLTFNAPEGDINKLNENAGKGNVELNPETIKILKKSQQVAKLSNGAFDVTVGPLVKTWGIGTKPQYIPTQEELKSLLPLINYKDLYVDDHSAGLKKAGQLIDLGGIAKGYAGDVAIEIYKKNGIKSGFISLGGNVVTLGSKPDGSPWSVGIRNPRPEGFQSGQIVGLVKVTDKAVVTAGDDQRYFEKDGQRFHHILDPKTGYPAKTDLMSVTLVMDSSLDADALDTAVFILGLEKGLEFIKQYDGVEAVFLTTDKRIVVTEGLKGKFELHDETNAYQYVK
jgi:FAD:protein FMN transferase